MNIKKLKIIALLALLAAASLEARAEPNEALAASPNLPSINTPAENFGNDTNFTFGSNNQYDTSAIFWRMLAAVIIVAALGACLYYVVKKFSSKVTALQSGRRIQILETAYLGSRKTVHLIKVENRKILIATTQTAITPITDLGEEQPPMDTNQQNQNNVG